MAKEDNFTNIQIAQNIIATMFHEIGDIQACLTFRFLDLGKKKDRELLRKNINGMMEIFNDALKELEEK